ncbi:transposase [Thioclava sp. 15-R06ZXC-3]|uniref:Transposase n=1 Tax=Thioclava arctica TaxID=3238301 RepID=A0ABV3TGD9_9RHOB
MFVICSHHASLAPTRQSLSRATSRAGRLGPASAAMLIAELPELGRMTAGEAAAMTGLAPVPHDSGAMRGRRAIAGGRRSPRHVLF